MTPEQVTQERVERVYRAMLEILLAPEVNVDIASTTDIMSWIPAPQVHESQNPQRYIVSFHDRLLRRIATRLTKEEAEQIGDLLRQDSWEVLVDRRRWHALHGHGVNISEKWWAVVAKHPKAQIKLEDHLEGPRE